MKFRVESDIKFAFCINNFPLSVCKPFWASAPVPFCEVRSCHASTFIAPIGSHFPYQCNDSSLKITNFQASLAESLINNKPSWIACQNLS